jgi:hypothetical protein
LYLLRDLRVLRLSRVYGEARPSCTQRPALPLLFAMRGGKNATSRRARAGGRCGPATQAIAADGRCIEGTVGKSTHALRASSVVADGLLHAAWLLQLPRTTHTHQTHTRPKKNNAGRRVASGGTSQRERERERDRHSAGSSSSIQHAIK